MHNPRANPQPILPLRPERFIRTGADRAFLITAVAATHDLLVMNHRPDLAPEFAPARTAVRSRPNAP